MEEPQKQKKMKILCLHGFRTSGSFLQKQISKWNPEIFAHFDMDFPDGIFPARGKSDIEGIFPPPYFEWFQFNKEFTEYENLEECISYLCEYITSKGGNAISTIARIPSTGSKFRDPAITDVAYKDIIKVKSVHFIGEKDWLKVPSEDLLTAFENPLLIRHPQGHTVPRLDEEATLKLLGWTKDILQYYGAAPTTDTHKHENGETKEIGIEETNPKPVSEIQNQEKNTRETGAVEAMVQA
ncbi:hypothetical protein FEM48_Zijuj07G0154000 [Ziziphus jujuba var. spinosa]|uniref:Serine hydrolase domain-containing protein n=1 Tax=Ziziphus jujuba var. spinosa TaxID=714518 RepID=A0A978V5F0_ZIZJJ|nr:hypothetical protein FEM48_Zijuj07G0154000 [Ziziphus jujuba var. spinosa]